MARIELRNAYLRFFDGHSNTGLVNDTPLTADTVMTVDTITGVIPNLARFTVVGASRKYQVVSTMGSPTTEITFTPALLTADGIPANNAAITFGGRFVEIKLGDGNLTYTEARELEYVLDRGDLDSVREGDQQPVAISLDFVWEFITASSGDTPTIDDVLKNIGEAADWDSSDADACAPYALDLEVEYVPPCAGEERETILFADFRWDELEHDLEAASVAITARANITRAAVTRAAY